MNANDLSSIIISVFIASLIPIAIWFLIKEIYRYFMLKYTINKGIQNAYNDLLHRDLERIIELLEDIRNSNYRN